MSGKHGSDGGGAWGKDFIATSHTYATMAAMDAQIGQWTDAAQGQAAQGEGGSDG